MSRWPSVDNGFRKIDGGDRGGEPPASPSAQAPLAYRQQRLRAANDNARPLGPRLRRHALFVAVGLILIALAWVSLS